MLQKLGGIKKGQIDLDKTECFRIIRASFIGNLIGKEKHVMMISEMLKNRKSFGKIYGVSWQIIIGMQNR